MASHPKILHHKDIIEACRKNAKTKIQEYQGNFAFNDDVWIKYGLNVNKSEADMQEYIHTHANHSIVYTPKVFEFFTAHLTDSQPELGFIVMEKIKGHTWDHYLKHDPSAKKEHKEQLGRIVEAIKHVWEIPVGLNPKIGPFGGRKAVGGFFDAAQCDEDFKTLGDLEKWINKKLDKKHENDELFGTKTPEHFRNISLYKEPACIAHCDLNPSNVFVDERITIIDWGWAGIYNKLFDVYGIYTLQGTRFQTFRLFGITLYDHLFERETDDYKEELRRNMVIMARVGLY